MSWKDLQPRNDILRPTLEFIGGPKRLGAVSTLLSAPVMYWLSKRIATRNGLPDARRRAAIVTGILSPLFGYGMYKMGKPLPGADTSKETFAKGIIGTDSSWVAKPEDVMASKPASDWADPFSEPLGKGLLMQGVDELDATPVQKTFLNNGIKFAPGDNSTTLWGLGDGFGKAVGSCTGGLIGNMTRAVEGAIIGGAFGALAGLSPTSRRWAAGIGAVADSLKGSEFYNALGEIN